MHKQHPQTAYRKDAVLIGTVFENCDKNKTVLIIAHWMRTVASADQVVVLSGGIVVEQGSPAELYARKGLYTHMGDRKTPLPGGGFSSGPSWWRLE